LLKLLLDFIRRLIARPEDHAADKSGDFRRIFQVTRQCALHPLPRLLGGTPDRVAAGLTKNAAILRIAHQKAVIHILPRQIRTHVEFPRIPRRRDTLHYSEKPQAIPELRLSAPPRRDRRIRGEHATLMLNPVEAEEEGGQSPSRKPGFADDRAKGGYGSRLTAEHARQTDAAGIVYSEAVEQKKRTGCEQINGERISRKEGDRRANRDGHDNH
jgi:hypothetical protein